MTTWCIVGASRGIGFEFVRQLLGRGDQVIAAVRDPYKASELWRLAATQTTPGACQLCECDVTSEASINVGCQSSFDTVKMLSETADVRSSSCVASSPQDRLPDT
jgi:NAD(P)-dependent dehydrogenase (short-subunit alcohol dehydrogenase family)